MEYINRTNKFIILLLTFFIILKENIEESLLDKTIIEKNIINKSRIIKNNPENNNKNLTENNNENITEENNKKNENQNEIKSYNENNKRIIKDVLFINGCNINFVPHPYRYRILHQMEQLNAGFLESDVFDYLNFEPIIVCNYRVIIFFRCPWTKRVDEAIKLAKSLNKKVLFDIDDLVIDTKYTDLIPYIHTFSSKKKKKYDNSVMRTGKTLILCDGAITTTETLAKELKNYVPKVFINRNVASEEMWKLSKRALRLKENQTVSNDYIIIGYFSGSITHNSDIDMITPALIQILKEYTNVKLLLSGLIEYSNDLIEFKNQIITNNFTDWKQLPLLISNVDINIAPLEDTIFNEAKSENKWVEASLVKVPTIASNIGAFKHVIIHNETGLLCDNVKDWYLALKTLINNESLRKYIGENAHKICRKKYNTIYTGNKLANYINSIANKHIGFFIPSLLNSGGMYVILKHACILQDEGWDVDFILPNVTINIYEFQEHQFNIINLNNTIMRAQYDIIVATLYTTVYSILSYYKTKKLLYLVQNYETNFYPYGNYFRPLAEKTYSVPFNLEYITISKWCEKWLWKKYKKKSKYAPNGIDIDNFKPHKRDLKNKKIRILIEGNCHSHYKNIDESFKIIENLDRNKYEVWYLSNHDQPKEWYQIDKFLNSIPHDEVINLYEQCDILLKSSWLESFSYPPLEMMATGGYVIVVSNGGNKEYLKDGYNCLIYTLGDINDAVDSINKLVSDKKLQEHLYVNGLITAQERDWKRFKDKIIGLYDD